MTPDPCGPRLCLPSFQPRLAGPREPGGLLGLFLNNEDLSVPLIYLCMDGGRSFLLEAGSARPEPLASLVRNAAPAQDAGRLPFPAYTWTNRAGSGPGLLLKTLPPARLPQKIQSPHCPGPGEGRGKRKTGETHRREGTHSERGPCWVGVRVFGEVPSPSVCLQVWSLSVSLSTSSSLSA